jgi:hypothetical protein
LTRSRSRSTLTICARTGAREEGGG